MTDGIKQTTSTAEDGRAMQWTEAVASICFVVGLLLAAGSATALLFPSATFPEDATAAWAVAGMVIGIAVCALFGSVLAKVRK